MGGAEKDAKTLVGGYATLMFFVMSTLLCGLVVYVFFEFNRDVSQVLVPKTATDIESDFHAKIVLIGYTGPTPITDFLVVSGVSCGEEETKTVTPENSQAFLNHGAALGGGAFTGEGTFTGEVLRGGRLRLLNTH